MTPIGMGLLVHDGFLTFGAVANPMLRMLDLQWEIQQTAAGLQETPLPGGFGPGWVVGETRVMARKEQLLALARGEIDPRQVALLDQPYPTGSRRTGDHDGWSANAIDYAVVVGADALVVTSEVWYPGWHATVDGQATPLLRADGLLRACRVPRGRHRLHVWYQPWWSFAFPLSGLIRLDGPSGAWLAAWRPGQRPLRRRGAPCGPRCAA